MFKKRIIHHILLDGSGSMQPWADTAVETCAALLERFRNEAAREADTEVLVGLSQFSETLQTLYRDKSPTDAQVPDPAVFPTDGDSALYHVFHELVGSLEVQWEESRGHLPTRVTLHTVTDGIDTASKDLGPADMLLLVERLKATGEWTFRFHGTDLDSLVSDALIAIRHRYRLPDEKELLCQALCDFFTADGHPPTPGASAHPPAGGGTD
jgi:hypothetical protein